LSFARYACLMAEALLGRGYLRIWGRLAAALDLPSAAFFASLSARSFPVTSLWLEIHLMESMHAVLLAARRRVCIKYCPAVVLGDLSAWITDWLSR